MGTVIPGPWRPSLDGRARLSPAQVLFEWRDYFDRVASGEQQISADIAPQLARYFHRTAVVVGARREGVE
jgi:hypothetical protein